MTRMIRGRPFSENVYEVPRNSTERRNSGGITRKQLSMRLLIVAAVIAIAVAVALVIALVVVVMLFEHARSHHGQNVRGNKTLESPFAGEDNRDMVQLRHDYESLKAEYGTINLKYDRMKNSLPVNIAAAKKAYQSSTLSDVSPQNRGMAFKAIDGNRNGVYHEGSCSHTDWGMSPWWAVDLVDKYLVVALNVTNRFDCCHSRLQDLRVYVGDHFHYQDGSMPDSKVCATVQGEFQPRTTRINCDQSIIGRFVKLTIFNQTTSQALTLCEVEIFGDKLF